MFQEELCAAVLRGLKSQLRKNGRMHDGEVGLHEVMLIADDEIEAFYATATMETATSSVAGKASATLSTI